MRRFVQVVKWLWGTSWPLYATTVLGSNMLGAFAVMVFVRHFLPLPEMATFATTTNYLHLVGVGYVCVATLVAGVATLMLFFPVLTWQHNPVDHDPKRIRRLVLRIPLYQAVLCGVAWLIGIAVVTVVASSTSTRLAVVVASAAGLGGAVVVLLTYLEAELLMRPTAATVLARAGENDRVEPPLRVRMQLTWLVSSAVPIVGMLLMVVGQRVGYFDTNPSEILPALIALSCTALLTGAAGTILLTLSIVDPISELREAIKRVRRGEIDTSVAIYDGSEIGVLQAGFNEMMRGLRERQRVHDLFGRYVGTEVASRALEELPTLGGEHRKVAVLFIDVIGSTSFTANHTPEEVVAALNDFFTRVVEVVHRNKGIINKFQGDAALAVFGAPLPLADAAGHALAAARELRQELKGLKLSCGIGVAAGHVVAGHIGGADRFEYTVIGDAVNQAARLTELAKDTPGQVLTSASTLRDANEAEQARWTVLKSVELRGRKEMTQLARPIRPTLADRS